MLYFLQQFLNGLHAGALYGLLAFGYVVTNGVLHRTNLAYGAVFALSGHCLILTAVFGWNVLWLALPIAIALGVVVAFAYAVFTGSILSRVVLQPLANRAPNTIVAATLGVAIVLMEISRISADTKDLWLPPLMSQAIVFAQHGTFDVTLTLNQILQCVVVVMVIAGGGLFLAKSSFGRRWRAVSDDPLAASMCGIDTVRTFHQAVLAGALAAALCGMLAALHYGNISFGTGLVYGLKILFVTAAGSYSSPVQAALGAAAFGIGESLWTAYFAAEWRDAWMLAFLAAMLILRASARE